jgi:hypothetical protein
MTSYGATFGVATKARYVFSFKKAARSKRVHLSVTTVVNNTNMLVKTTSNTSLNKKLYAKLLLCLEGQVYKIWCPGNIFVLMVFFY